MKNRIYIVYTVKGSICVGEDILPRLSSQVTRYGSRGDNCFKLLQQKSFGDIYGTTLIGYCSGTSILSSQIHRKCENILTSCFSGEHDYPQEDIVIVGYYAYHRLRSKRMNLNYGLFLFPFLRLKLLF